MHAGPDHGDTCGCAAPLPSHPIPSHPSLPSIKCLCTSWCRSAEPWCLFPPALIAEAGWIRQASLRRPLSYNLKEGAKPCAQTQPLWVHAKGQQPAAALHGVTHIPANLRSPVLAVTSAVQQPFCRAGLAHANISPMERQSLWQLCCWCPPGILRELGRCLYTQQGWH